jgi:putative membrane protein
VLNACINGTCFILLWISLYFIRKKRIDMHKRINLTAFGLSAIFLISYVLFHYLHGDTIFPKESPWRLVYLVILISHIILAAVVLPLILFTLFGFKK